MLTEHLKQAAALESVLSARPMVVQRGSELARAAVDCAGRLLLWGEADRVLELVRNFLDECPDLLPLDRLQLHIAELRALAMLRRDHECVLRARSVLTSNIAEGSGLRAELTFVRTLEASALWHMNRIAEAK